MTAPGSSTSDSFAPYRQAVDDAIATAQEQLAPGEELPIGTEIAIVARTAYAQHFSEEIAGLKQELAVARATIDSQRHEVGRLAPLAEAANELDAVRGELGRTTQLNRRLAERITELETEIGVLRQHEQELQQRLATMFRLASD